MRYLFLPLIPFFAGIAGLVMFLTWYSAISFLTLIFVSMYLMLRKHDNANQYDDRKSKEDREKAIDWYIKEVINKNEKK